MEHFGITIPESTVEHGATTRPPTPGKGLDHDLVEEQARRGERQMSARLWGRVLRLH